MHVHVCVTIDAPPERVWGELEHVDRHVEWMRDAESIRFRTDQREGVSVEFECDTRVGPFRTTDRMTVTEWDPGVAMGIEHRGIVTGTGRFTLTPTATGSTHFCWDEHLRFPLRMGGRPGEIAARPVLERIWRTNLQRLKQQVEGS